MVVTCPQSLSSSSGIRCSPSKLGAFPLSSCASAVLTSLEWKRKSECFAVTCFFLNDETCGTPAPTTMAVPAVVLEGAVH
jgi:hypothetical protein